MPGEPCPGSCNSKARKDAATYKAALVEWDDAMAARAEGDPGPPRPVPPDIRPWAGEPVWCLKCGATIRRELAELDDLAAIVAHASDGHREVMTEGRVSGSRTPPSPSPAVEDLDELASVLRGWESALRGSDPAARRGYLASEITTSVAWLSAHFEPLIGSPDYGGDFGAEIRQWHKRLRDLGKAGTVRHRLPMPCPRCRRYSLTAEDGAQYVECATDCGRLMTRLEYDAEFEEWTRTAGKLGAPT
jgi:hypothetical protein